MKLINFLFDRDIDVLAVAGGGIWATAEHLELGIKILIGISSLGYIIWKWQYEYKKNKYNEDK